MAITKIKVKNLTVFANMVMYVDANVNVLIGENGTGKTHLLKFIYTAIMEMEIDAILRSAFMVQTRELLRSGIDSIGEVSIFLANILEIVKLKLMEKAQLVRM